MVHDDPLAEAAIAPVSSGMCVGLGTGRAASRAIKALSARTRSERLAIRCVATSIESAQLAETLGLEVIDLDRAGRIDYLFDGADEVDDRLRMIKGRGGAMTREKIVAHAADRRVYLVQRSKSVAVLGSNCPLPIEVLAFGAHVTGRALERLGLSGPFRAGPGGRVYLTDNGNPVIDARLPPETELERLCDRLGGTPGVVGHGLFLTEADEVIVEETEGGPVCVRRR